MALTVWWQGNDNFFESVNNLLIWWPTCFHYISPLTSYQLTFVIKISNLSFNNIITNYILILKLGYHNTSYFIFSIYVLCSFQILHNKSLKAFLVHLHITHAYACTHTLFSMSLTFWTFFLLCGIKWFVFIDLLNKIHIFILPSTQPISYWNINEEGETCLSLSNKKVQLFWSQYRLFAKRTV